MPGPSSAPETIGALLRHAAERAPDAPALLGIDTAGQIRRWTYAELLATAERGASALLARFQPGERVACWSPNNPEVILLQYGAALAGLTVVPLNPGYRPEEVGRFLRASEAAGIFHVPSAAGRPLAATIGSLRTSLPDLREVVLLPQWQEVVDATSPRDLPIVDPGAAAVIQFTWLVPGGPREVVISHRSATTVAVGFAERLGLRGNDVLVNPMPLYHMPSLVLGLLGSARAGAAHVPAPPVAAIVLDLVARERATVLAGVPQLCLRIIDAPGFLPEEVATLRAVYLGGLAASSEQVRQIERRLGAPVATVLGFPECSGLLCQGSLEGSAECKAASLGRPIPQTEVRIVNPATEAVCPPGVPGGIQVRGPLVALSAGDDGWYVTGRFGSQDGAGNLAVDPSVVPGIPGRVHPDELPPAWLQLEHYCRSGQHALQLIEAALGVAGRSWGSLESVLDMPSGYGRVLRWLVQAVPAGIVTAADILPEAVRFCADEFGVTALQSDADFRRVRFAASYDLVWVGSLLTHLPVDACWQLIDILGRHLAPGGVLVFTTHGQGAIQRLDGYGQSFALDPTAFEGELARRGVVFSPYIGQRDYGITVHHPDTIASHLRDAQPGLRLLDFAAEGWDQHQDVWTVQRPHP